MLDVSILAHALLWTDYIVGKSRERESGDQSETAAHLDAFISRRPFAERVVLVDASKGFS